MGPSIGYIRLYRQLLQHPIWRQLAPAVLKVAIYFLLRANYRPGDWYDGLKTVRIPAGSFITSYAKTAAECNLSIQQVRDAFGHLERVGFSTYRRTRHCTTVTVVNYRDYQATVDDENTMEDTCANSPENAIGTPSKEIKNIRRNTCASPNGNARIGSLPLLDDQQLETAESEAALPVERTPKAKSDGGLTQEQERWFQEWWDEYWRHDARKAAREAFRKHVQTRSRFDQIMAATRAQAQEMRRRERSKRPQGASWLNGERWEDDLSEAELPPARQTEQAAGSIYTKWEPPGGPE